ncbi:MAG: hypothetical protein ACOCVF_04175, partial [bacterium]
MKKVKFKREVYLPTNLLKEVKRLMDKVSKEPSKNNYKLVVGEIFHKSITNPYPYFPFAKSFWVKAIGSHYQTYVKPLLENKIIEKERVDGNILSDINKKYKHREIAESVLGYRINPEYLNNEFELMDYWVKFDVSMSTDTSTNKSVNISTDTSTVFIEKDEQFWDNVPVSITNNFSPKNITMRKPEALKWLHDNASQLVRENINFDFIEGLPPKMKIKISILNDSGGVYEIQYHTVDSAKEKSISLGKELFYYKKGFMIADVDKFLQETTKKLIYHYTWRINTFHHDNFDFTSKKEDKLRVTSKLTTLPSALLKFVQVNDENAVQADLKCSQFTLFANLLNLYIINRDSDFVVNLFKKEPTRKFIKNLVGIFEEYQQLMPECGLDYNQPKEDKYYTKNNNIYKFIVDVLLNDFYSVLKKQLNLPLRAHAKHISFLTLFSNPKSKNDFETQFSEKYLRIIDMINDFKNEHGYNNFSIGLQNVESELFIHNIWAKTLENEITSFTRHDSLVFPRNKKDDVESIINNAFDKYKFIHQIEYDDFVEKEIWDELIYNTSYIDSVGMEDEVDELFHYSMNENKNNGNENIDVELNKLAEPAKSTKSDRMPVVDKAAEEAEIEEEEEKVEITDENYWTYIQDKLNEAWVKIPEEIMDDYFGCDSIDLLLDEL